MSSSTNNLWKRLTPSVTSVTSTSLSSFWRLQHPKPLKNGLQRLPKFKIQRLCIIGKNQLINQDGLSLLAPHLQHIDIPSISIKDGKTLFEGLPRDLCEITKLDLIKSICPSITSIGENVTLTFPPTFLQTSTPKNLAIIEALPRTLTKWVTPVWNAGWVRGLPPALTHLKIECSVSTLSPSDDSCFLDVHPLSKLISLSISQVVDRTGSFCATLPRSLTELCMNNVYGMTASEFASLPPSLVTLKLPRLERSDHLSNLACRDLRTLELGFFCPSIVDLPPTLTQLNVQYLGFEQSQLEILKPYLRLENPLPSLFIRNRPAEGLSCALTEAALEALQSLQMLGTYK
jgi:hypothetical protein